MSKVDLSNPMTWYASPKPSNSALLGKIANRIGEIKTLRQKLTSHLKKDSFEYSTAENLKDSNYEAFCIMGVTYYYSEENSRIVLRMIDKVLAFWKDDKNRTVNFQQILPEIQALEPYLNDPDQLNSLNKIQVRGNAAWKLYLEQRQTIDKLTNEVISYERYNDES